MRDDVIRMSIRWKGGATAVIERPLPLGAPDLRRTPADIVEQVQRGVRSRLYDRGRYSPVREQGLHHFHRLLTRLLD